MPIHTYKCLTCLKEEDRIVKFSDAENLQKCSCSEELSMQRLDTISRPGYQFKGKWHKTTGSY